MPTLLSSVSFPILCHNYCVSFYLPSDYTCHRSKTYVPVIFAILCPSSLHPTGVRSVNSSARGHSGWWNGAWGGQVRRSEGAGGATPSHRKPSEAWRGVACPSMHGHLPGPGCSRGNHDGDPALPGVILSHQPPTWWRAPEKHWGLECSWPRVYIPK